MCKIEEKEMSNEFKYKMTTLGEVKKKLENWYVTLFVPKGMSDDTKGFIMKVKGGLQFNCIEE